MLERFFKKPQTIDRIRDSWLSSAIEQYVTWMVEQQYAVCNVHRRVPILIRFGEFAATRGASATEDLPKHVEPFITDWMSRQDCGRRLGTARTGLAKEIRGRSRPLPSPVELHTTFTKPA